MVSKDFGVGTLPFVTAQIDLPEVPLPERVNAESISALAGRYFGQVPGSFTVRMKKPRSAADYGTRVNPWILAGSFSDGTGQGSATVRLWLTPDGTHITGHASGFVVNWWATRVVVPLAVLGLAVYVAIDTRSPGYLAFALINIPLLWLAYSYSPRAWRLMLQGLAQNGLRALFGTIASTDPGEVRIWDDADRFAASGGWSAVGDSARRAERAHRWRKRPWWWIVLRSGIGAFALLALVAIAADATISPSERIRDGVILGVVLILTVAVPVAAALRRTKKAPAGTEPAADDER